jgi:hypothetical protein
MLRRLERIKRKVATDRKTLNPVLGASEVSAFESRHNVSLPEGYRRFLVEIGNGGDGPPFYRLVSLGRGASSSSRPEVDYWEQLPDIRRPFPITKPWRWGLGEVSEGGIAEQVRHGSLFIGEDGCGMDWRLIVTGPERGNVWQAGDMGIAPTRPKFDFLAWYEQWLDGRRDWWAPT